MGPNIAVLIRAAFLVDSSNEVSIPALFHTFLPDSSIKELKRGGVSDLITAVVFCIKIKV